MFGFETSKDKILDHVFEEVPVFVWFDEICKLEEEYGWAWREAIDEKLDLRSI